MNAELGGFLNHEVHSTSFERSLSQGEVKGGGCGRGVFRNADLGVGRRDMENLTVIGYSSFIVQGDSCATPEPQDMPQMMKLCPAELSPILDDGLG